MVAPTKLTIEGAAFTPVSNEVKSKILTPEAVSFIATLHRLFNGRRLELLAARDERQKSIDAGNLPDFLPHTKHIRDDPTWQGPTLAPGLKDRRVEITGPTDRKMVINALNSNVYVYMSDFEDSATPTWANASEGQVNLYDAIRDQITLKQGEKTYALNKDRSTYDNKSLPTLMVRPRGWHLNEEHFTVDGEPISGAIFDFGLYFFHNAKELIARGRGPYFYLPKMESHLEARLWNDIFNLSQDWIGIPRGTIRATCLIETILAVFEMDEIIYELRDHSAGLNCGRWDYIFSFAKTLRAHPGFTLPDRDDVTMTVPFMNAYVRLLIQTCHKRGVHAMGGMAAQIPIKNDPKANEVAMKGVRADKLREALAGHDGTWVAHPALAQSALDVFNKEMPGPNQIFKRHLDTRVTARDLINPIIPGGRVTEAGIRKSLYIALVYMEAWLRGQGTSAINWLMEDAATAEVSRALLNSWVKHGIVTAEGKKVTPDYVLSVLNEELASVKKSSGGSGRFDDAAKALIPEITNEKFSQFLTTLLYPQVKTTDAGSVNKL